jgi:ABC-type spermidine/putrescine transport system permease subunit II
VGDGRRDRPAATHHPYLGAVRHDRRQGAARPADEARGLALGGGSGRSDSTDLFTTTHYRTLFSIDDTRLALRNSLMLGVLSGAVYVAIGALISYMELRRRTWLAATVAFLGVLPVAIPGIVYGIGLLWTYLGTPLYGTVWILLLAYIAKYLPYAIVVSRAGLLQMNRELEECARIVGAGPFTTMTRITAPILKPVLVTIFFLIMLLSIEELSASVLLYSERGPVLSVLTWSYMESGNFQFAGAIGIVQSAIMVGLVLLTRLGFRVNLEKATAESDRAPGEPAGPVRAARTRSRGQRECRASSSRAWSRPTAQCGPLTGSTSTSARARSSRCADPRGCGKTTTLRCNGTFTRMERSLAGRR